MAFGPHDSWVWDCWLTEDGGVHHLFFLTAPRTAGDPEGRHVRAGVGHATSTDLRTWTRVEDALAHGEEDDADALATWTGCVVRRPDGAWRMFYTGARRTPAGIAQTVCCADSPDLLTWTKSPANPVVSPDPGRYETFPGTADSDSWRDPWVLADAGGDGWHMLITARSRTGPPDERGVVGHAWSADLDAWEVRPPLSAPGRGFPFLEVMQTTCLGDQHVLLFSCPADEVGSSVVPANPHGGIWAAPAEGPLGPFDLPGARQLVDDGSYSGRLAHLRDAGSVLLAFDRDPASLEFLTIRDPLVVGVAAGRGGWTRAPGPPPPAATPERALAGEPSGSSVDPGGVHAGHLGRGQP